MIPGRRDYNLVGTEDDPIPENEPVFILRAQDTLAEFAVRIYAVLARQAGRWDIERGALAVAEQMAAWPTKKLPDLPREK